MKPYNKPQTKPYIHHESFTCDTCEEIIHDEIPLETENGGIECLECSDELSGFDTHEYEYLGNF